MRQRAFERTAWVVVWALLSCTQQREVVDSAKDAATDASASNDETLPPICRLTAAAAASMNDAACRIQLGQQPEDSPIYQSLAKLEPGIVESAERCSDHPLAWYRDGAASPTTLVACTQACERSAQLFASFVAGIKPLAGCQDHMLVKALCSLPERGFLGISESSCALPIARPEDRTLAYDAAKLRGAEIVASYDDCESHPLALFPNRPDNPTQLVACDGACVLSAGLFPAFVAAAWRLIGCDGVVGAP